MANDPFDRTILNPLEKPFSSDMNQSQSQSDFALRFLIEQMFNRRTGNTSPAPSAGVGFVGYSMTAVAATVPDMTVRVSRGLGFFSDPTDTPSGIDGIAGLDDLSPIKPVVLMTAVVFAVPAAPGPGNSRIDIIEAHIRREVTNPSQRLVLDPGTGAFNPLVVDKTLAFTLDGSVGTVVSPAPSTAALSYKQGVAAVTGTEVEPSVTPGYVQIARINVGPSVSSIGEGEIVDRRKLLGEHGSVHASANFRQRWNGGVPIVDLNSFIGPPGAKIGILADSGSGAHNAGSLVVGGLGQVTRAMLMMSAHDTAGGAIIGRAAVPLFAANLSIVGTPSSGQKTAFASANIPILFAIGQQLIGSAYEAIISTGSNLDPALDDLMWDVHVVGAYH
jgi:hypothetical protein